MPGGRQQEGARGILRELAVDAHRSLGIGEQPAHHRDDATGAGQLGERLKRRPGHAWPSLETFAELARTRRVIPVVRRLLADAETPVGVYRKLAKDAPGTFLLESAEHGGVWSRYSIVGAACGAVLTERDGVTHWIGDPPVGVPTDGN